MRTKIIRERRNEGWRFRMNLATIHVFVHVCIWFLSLEYLSFHNSSPSQPIALAYWSAIRNGHQGWLVSRFFFFFFLNFFAWQNWISIQTNWWTMATRKKLKKKINRSKGGDLHQGPDNIFTLLWYTVISQITRSLISFTVSLWGLSGKTPTLSSLC